MTLRRAALSIDLLLLGLLFAWFVNDWSNTVARTESTDLAGTLTPRLQPGITSIEVEEILSRGSKNRYRCSHGVEVYPIGDHDPARASILYLRYRYPPEEPWIPEGIGSSDQDMLFQFKSYPATVF